MGRGSGYHRFHLGGGGVNRISSTEHLEGRELKVNAGGYGWKRIAEGQCLAGESCQDPGDDLDPDRGPIQLNDFRVSLMSSDESFKSDGTIDF